jgi:hypothetical protein
MQMASFQNGQLKEGEAFLKAHSEGTTLPAPDRSEALSADLLEFVMEQLRKRNYNDADLHRTFGQTEKAVEIYQAALDLYMSSLGEADDDIAQLAEAPGAASLEVNDVERARVASRLALDMRSSQT